MILSLILRSLFVVAVFCQSLSHLALTFDLIIGVESVYGKSLLAGVCELVAPSFAKRSAASFP